MVNLIDPSVLHPLGNIRHFRERGIGKERAREREGGRKREEGVEKERDGETEGGGGRYREREREREL